MLCCLYQCGISTSNIHFQHDLKQVARFSPLSNCQTSSQEILRERQEARNWFNFSFCPRLRPVRAIFSIYSTWGCSCHPSSLCRRASAACWSWDTCRSVCCAREDFIWKPCISRSPTPLCSTLPVQSQHVLPILLLESPFQPLPPSPPSYPSLTSLPPTREMWNITFIHHVYTHTPNTC